MLFLMCSLCLVAGDHGYCRDQELSPDRKDLYHDLGFFPFMSAIKTDSDTDFQTTAMGTRLRQQLRRLRQRLWGGNGVAGVILRMS